MRKHKIAFVSFKKDNKDQFEDYKTDVLEDINSLSDTYGYRNLVGRVRKWENEITISCFLDKIDDYIKWIKRLELHDENQYRRLELIITLFIGSINDVSNLSLENRKYKCLMENRQVYLWRLYRNRETNNSTRIIRNRKDRTFIA